MPETEATPVIAPVEDVPAVNISADATITESPLDAVDMTLPGGEKLLAALGYIGFFCILPLLAKPKSELCQHHGKQAMAVTIVFFLVSAVIANFALFVGTSGALLKFGVIVNIAWAVAAIMGMMAASAGKMANLPFFSGIAKKLNW